MNERIYDYWIATLQDGYIGNLIRITQEAGGAKSLYNMSKNHMISELGLSQKLSDHIAENRPGEDHLTVDYERMLGKGISYVNYTDDDFPPKLRNIASPPYGIFVKGSLPDPNATSVAIVGARDCSEYGRLMAEYFGNRLAREGVQVISGMAWGIDGIAQSAALAAGGRSFAVMGCGVDITYPAKNAVLYRRLCSEGNGVISEYAPQTPAIARQFPPRNRIISALSDVLIVVEARAKSGTLITVDMAIDQGRTVMVVPGRLTDNLSVGCLKLLYQGALPAIGIDSVLEQLGLQKCVDISTHKKQRQKKEANVAMPNGSAGLTPDLQTVADILSLEPLSIDDIARRSGLDQSTAMIMLTKLEMTDQAKEIFPGFFVRQYSIT
ncbi:MAG: DNA-processing protein DprA [Lachnospiraceae bacterium]|nr:DNA-processing protein DprA [Lachnospiraceae bacterium]